MSIFEGLPAGSREVIQLFAVVTSHAFGRALIRWMVTEARWTVASSVGSSTGVAAVTAALSAVRTQWA